MIVVSDTSPLNYFVLIDLQHILPELFERILIPAAVRDELQSRRRAGPSQAISCDETTLRIPNSNDNIGTGHRRAIASGGVERYRWPDGETVD